MNSLFKLATKSSTVSFLGSDDFNVTAVMHVCRDVVLILLLLCFSLFLTWLLDSTWSLRVFLRFQSTECWQNLQSNSSPDTYKSFGNCSSLYWGANVKFLIFPPTRTEPWTAASPCFHSFDGEGLSLCRFPQTYDPLPHEDSITAKVSQIPIFRVKKIDSVLISQFCDCVCFSVIADIIGP